MALQQSTSQKPECGALVQHETFCDPLSSRQPSPEFGSSSTLFLGVRGGAWLSHPNGPDTQRDVLPTGPREAACVKPPRASDRLHRGKTTPMRRSAGGHAFVSRRKVLEILINATELAAILKICRTRAGEKTIELA